MSDRLKNLSSGMLDLADELNIGEVPKATPEHVAKGLERVSAAASTMTERVERAMETIKKKGTDGGFEVPLSTLDFNPVGIRKKWREDTIRERAASIEKHGQLDSIKVCRHFTEPGRWFIIDGGYRTHALRRLGRANAVVREIEVDDMALLARLSAELNDEREPHSPLDQAKQWHALLSDGHVKNVLEISDRWGVASPAISKAISAAKMPEVVLNAIEDSHRPERFGYTVLYSLSLLTDDKGWDNARRLKIVKGIADGDISRSMIERMREAGPAALEKLLAPVRETAQDRAAGEPADPSDAAQTPAKKRTHVYGRPHRLQTAAGQQFGKVLARDTGRIEVVIDLPEDTDPDKFAGLARDMVIERFESMVAKAKRSEPKKPPSA